MCVYIHTRIYIYTCVYIYCKNYPKFCNSDFEIKAEKVRQFLLSCVHLYSLGLFFILLILKYYIQKLILKFFFLVLSIHLFWDRVYLWGLDCPGTYSAAKTGLELRDPPSSASQGIKFMCYHCLKEKNLLLI